MLKPKIRGRRISLRKVRSRCPRLFLLPLMERLQSRTMEQVRDGRAEQKRFVWEWR